MSTSLPHEIRTATEPRQRGLHSVILSRITQVNPTIRLLRLSIPPEAKNTTSNPEPAPQPFQFAAGQWLDVHIPSIPQAGGFTITSTPADALPSSTSHSEGNRKGYLELAIQRSPNNPPAAWLWRSEDQILGTELQVRVGGSFVWPPTGIEQSSIQNVVFVAGGVGINPLMSMVSHIQQSRLVPRTMYFLYSTRRPSAESAIDDVLFVRRLSDIAYSEEVEGRLRLNLFLTGEEDRLKNIDVREPWNLQKRRITEEDLLASVGYEADREGTVCYICGPSGMTDELVELVEDLPGMSKDRILIEKWW